jgi:hypothetical protein
MGCEFIQPGTRDSRLVVEEVEVVEGVEVVLSLHL